MNIIQITANENGAYPPMQSWDSPTPPDGYALVPDTVGTESFYSDNGFVVLTIEGDTVTAMEPTMNAWEAWKASLPPPVEPEPTPEDITLDMLADHEGRICMMELTAAE